MLKNLPLISLCPGFPLTAITVKKTGGQGLTWGCSKESASRLIAQQICVLGPRGHLWEGEVAHEKPLCGGYVHRGSGCNRGS